MKYQFISRNATFSDNKKERSKDVLSRLTKFSSKEPVSCVLTLSKVLDGVIKLDAKLVVDGNCYLASEENDDFNTALDRVYDKLKKQLRRSKDKQIAKDKVV